MCSQLTDFRRVCCFRSSGALLAPKLGLLGIVLDMVQALSRTCLCPLTLISNQVRCGHLRDCLLVPVAIDYERTPEVQMRTTSLPHHPGDVPTPRPRCSQIQSFVRQALGAPKRKDSLSKLFSTGCVASHDRQYASTNPHPCGLVRQFVRARAVECTSRPHVSSRPDSCCSCHP